MITAEIHLLSTFFTFCKISEMCYVLYLYLYTCVCVCVCVCVCLGGGSDSPGRPRGCAASSGNSLKPFLPSRELV